MANKEHPLVTKAREEGAKAERARIVALVEGIFVEAAMKLRGDEGDRELAFVNGFCGGLHRAIGLMLEKLEPSDV